MSPINTAEAPKVSSTPTTLGELDLYLKNKKTLIESAQYEEFAKKIGDQRLAHTTRLDAFTGDKTDSLIVERVTATGAFIKEIKELIDAKAKITETTKAADIARNKVSAAGASTPELNKAEEKTKETVDNEKRGVVTHAKKLQQNERRTIEGQNTTVEQAKSFVAFLESYPDLKDSNFVKQLKGEVFIQGSESSPSESYGTSRNGSKEAIYRSSVKMNIPSLIAHAVKGTPYVNFSSGFGGYQDNFIAVTKEAYKDPKIKAALDAFYTITQSGATGETALRASEAIKTAPKTRAELTTLLVSLTAGDDTLSDGKGAIFNLTGTQLKKFLSDTKESEFIPTLSKALLVSRSTYSISTLEKLGQDIQTNPSLAFAILGGLNTMDRNGGITSFDTTSALKEAEALKKIGDKLKKALDEARNTLPANLTESQKKAALEALDLMKKEANLPDAQKAFGLFFTNQGAAAGANISKLVSPDTSLSAGVTVAGGKLAVEFAMRSMVSNTISGGTSIGAGVGATIGGPAVLPFAEIGRTNHQASGNLRIFPMGGFAITLASELSNVNKVVRQASEMVRDKNSLALKLNEFRVAGVKADTIKFTPDISSVASDEKAGVESLVNETNERTQGLLKARGFDTITDETARYIMLEQAIKDATQETTLAITRNMLSAGPRWKSIGLTFGKIWSFPFIIPFGSRGNDEMNVTRIPGQKTEGKKTEEKGLSIDAYLSDKKVTDTKDAKGNITSRTFHFDPKKFIVSGDTTRDGGTVQNGSTPH